MMTATRAVGARLAERRFFVPRSVLECSTAEHVLGAMKTTAKELGPEHRYDSGGSYFTRRGRASSRIRLEIGPRIVGEVNRRQEAALRGV